MNTRDREDGRRRRRRRKGGITVYDDPLKVLIKGIIRSWRNWNLRSLRGLRENAADLFCIPLKRGIKGGMKGESIYIYICGYAGEGGSVEMILVGKLKRPT